jgi:hypothetical protein
MSAGSRSMSASWAARRRRSPAYQLEAALHPPNDDRLEQAVLLERRGQLGELSSSKCFRG